MKTRKILSLILIAVMVFVLAACGDSGEDEPVDPPVNPVVDPVDPLVDPVDPVKPEEPDNDPEEPSEITFFDLIQRLHPEALAVPDDYDMPYAIKVNTRNNYVVIYERKNIVFPFDKDLNITTEGVPCYLPYRADLCSCGLPGDETTLGEFYISNQWDWATLIQSMYGQYTSRFNGSYLFHTVPYSVKYDPSTLMGAEYNKLGQAASHGCVRLTVEAGKFIYDNCKAGTYVYIVDSDEECPIATTPVLKIDPECTWDPTDPNPDNPWLSDPEYMLLKD